MTGRASANDSDLSTSPDDAAATQAHAKRTDDDGTDVQEYSMVTVDSGHYTGEVLDLRESGHQQDCTCDARCSSALGTGAEPAAPPDYAWAPDEVAACEVSSSEAAEMSSGDPLLSEMKPPGNRRLRRANTLRSDAFQYGYDPELLAHGGPAHAISAPPSLSRRTGTATQDLSRLFQHLDISGERSSDDRRYCHPGEVDLAAPVREVTAVSPSAQSSSCSAVSWTGATVEPAARADGQSLTSAIAPETQVGGSEWLAAMLDAGADELPEQDRDMTVEAWISWTAVAAEQQLLEECERLVYHFEQEGAHALRALERLQCSD
ncbi:hypothetical protein KEM52_005938 [Ascosphaera acerosa]|nr:hypothetical protein KEM52_005938 [Ascosphaera acerosa]